MKGIDASTAAFFATMAVLALIVIAVAWGPR